MKIILLPISVLGALCTLVLLPACESMRPDPQAAAASAVAPAIGQDLKSVVKDKAPLYEKGPEQMNPPEATLERNAWVKVLRSQFGYSLVQTENSQTGWVATEDLGDIAVSSAQ